MSLPGVPAAAVPAPSGPVPREGISTGGAATGQVISPGYAALRLARPVTHPVLAWIRTLEHLCAHLAKR